MTRLRDSTLGERLQALAETFRRRRPDREQAIHDQALDELRCSGLLKEALAVGETAPDFELPDAEGRLFSSGPLLAAGPLVVAFYRGGWCPYCNLMLRALHEVLPAITAAGAKLVAISPELPQHALETRERLELGFTLLFDQGGHVARLFGLRYEMPALQAQLYREKGIDIAAHNGTGRPLLPLAATYVLASDGTAVHAFLDCDPARRVEPDSILAALAALRDGGTS